MNIDDGDRDLLEQRAAQLARPRAALKDKRAQEASAPFAIFERAGVRYAIHPHFVFEVSRVLAPTPLPMAAPHWLGVSSLHGELIALVDLAVLFGHGGGAPLSESVGHDAQAAERRSSLVLVLGSERRELGLLIDRVHEAKPLLETLTRVPAGDVASQLLHGTTDDNVRVLHGEALLADPRLTIQANHPSEA
jgi:purine-binding chemotaxis protein CheW